MSKGDGQNMKKTKKGLTLVEVIVAIAVFAVITLALFSTYLGIRKLSFRQEEYVRLEMVCYDINYYWDAYGDKWAAQYTGKDDANSAKGTISLDSNFKFISGNSTYVIEYEKNEKGELIIKTVKSIATNKVYIENLNCGISPKNNSTEGNSQ